MRLRKGDKFSEHSGSRFAARFVALTDSVLDSEDCWRVDGEFTNHEGVKSKVEFSSHKDWMQHGPRLYLGETVPYFGVIYLNDIPHQINHQ